MMQSSTNIVACSSKQDAEFISNLIPMKSEFAKEDHPACYLLTEEARAPYIVTIKNGQCYDAQHQPLSLGWYTYVLDVDNRIYACPTKLKWNHSYFLAGAPVKAAGLFEVNQQGFMVTLSNESGHYCPTTEAMAEGIVFFYENVVNCQDIQPIYYEMHDEAKTAGVIKFYLLSDIANFITETIENSDENDIIEMDFSELEASVQGYYYKNSTDHADDSKGQVNGYSEECGDESDTLANHKPSNGSSTKQLFSRFGAAPSKCRMENHDQMLESSDEDSSGDELSSDVDESLSSNDLSKGNGNHNLFSRTFSDDDFQIKKDGIYSPDQDGGDLSLSRVGMNKFDF